MQLRLRWYIKHTHNTATGNLICKTVLKEKKLYWDSKLPVLSVRLIILTMKLVLLFFNSTALFAVVKKEKKKALWNPTVLKTKFSVLQLLEGKKTILLPMPFMLFRKEEVTQKHRCDSPLMFKKFHVYLEIKDFRGICLNITN